MKYIKTYKSLSEMEGMPEFFRLTKLFIPYSAIQEDGSITTLKVGNSNVPEEEGIFRIVDDHIAELLEHLRVDKSGEKYLLYVDDEIDTAQPKLSSEEDEMIQLQAKLKELQKAKEKKEIEEEEKLEEQLKIKDLPETS